MGTSIAIGASVEFKRIVEDGRFSICARCGLNQTVPRCYVDDPNNCPDARPSSWGASYSWSCQACRNRGGLPEEPECPVTDGAYINQGRNTADGSSLRSRGETDCARKCYEDLTCEAWTMRKDNNLCWLKTTSEGTTPSRRWVWGLPCGPDGGEILIFRNFLVCKLLLVQVAR